MSNLKTCALTLGVLATATLSTSCNVGSNNEDLEVGAVSSVNNNGCYSGDADHVISGNSRGRVTNSTYGPPNTGCYRAYKLDINNFESVGEDVVFAWNGATPTSPGLCAQSELLVRIAPGATNSYDETVRSAHTYGQWVENSVLGDHCITPTVNITKTFPGFMQSGQDYRIVASAIRRFSNGKDYGQRKIGFIVPEQKDDASKYCFKLVNPTREPLYKAPTSFDATPVFSGHSVELPYTYVVGTDTTGRVTASYLNEEGCMRENLLPGNWTFSILSLASIDSHNIGLSTAPGQGQDNASREITVATNGTFEQVEYPITITGGEVAAQDRIWLVHAAAAKSLATNPVNLTPEDRDLYKVFVGGFDQSEFSSSVFAYGNVYILNADAREKFVIGHEIGHALLRKNAGSSLPTDSSLNSGSCGGSGHGFGTLEYSGLAFNEGFGHFFAAMVFNDSRKTCTFHSERNGTFSELNCNTATDVDAGIVRKVGHARVNCAASQPTHSNETDWLRVLYGLHREPGVDFAMIMEWIVSVHQDVGFDRDNAFFVLDDAADARGENDDLNRAWDEVKGPHALCPTTLECIDRGGIVIP